MKSPARLGEPLTDRERHVLALMAHGLSNAAIGSRLGVSETTVKTYAARTFRKLGAANRANAVLIGFVKGILQLPRPGEVSGG